jgi:hypothetical protein
MGSAVTTANLDDDAARAADVKQLVDEIVALGERRLDVQMVSPLFRSLRCAPDASEALFRAHVDAIGVALEKRTNFLNANVHEYTFWVTMVM